MPRRESVDADPGPRGMAAPEVSLLAGGGPAPSLIAAGMMACGFFLVRWAILMLLHEPQKINLGYRA